MNSKRKPPRARDGDEQGTVDKLSVHENPKPVHSEKGKVVGQVIGRTFTKHVDSTKHMLKRPKAWAADIASLKEAQELGADTIELRDDNAQVTWTAPIEAFWGRRSITCERGFGKQRAVLLEAWQMSGKNIPEQLSMFGDETQTGLSFSRRRDNWAVAA